MHLFPPQFLSKSPSKNCYHQLQVTLLTSLLSPLLALLLEICYLFAKFLVVRRFQKKVHRFCYQSCWCHAFLPKIKIAPHQFLSKWVALFFFDVVKTCAREARKKEDGRAPAGAGKREEKERSTKSTEGRRDEGERKGGRGEKGGRGQGREGRPERNNLLTQSSPNTISP